MSATPDTRPPRAGEVWLVVFRGCCRRQEGESESSLSRESAEVLKSYSKLVSSQGGLFANHNFPVEAEQAFRLATEICPYSPEAVFRLVNLLVEQNRFEDALPVAENAVKAEPQNQQFRSLVEELIRTKKH